MIHKQVSKYSSKNHPLQKKQSHFAIFPRTKLTTTKAESPEKQPMPSYTPLPADWEASQHPLLKNKANVTNVVQTKTTDGKKRSLSRESVLAEEQLNHTGMPDQLKAGLEHLSGRDLSDVRVHRNSSKPSQMQALAYTQGTNIYLGPGQERHLPHEGWHVVQQMEERVKPTLQMAGGVSINDDTKLEREADIMGANAINFSSTTWGNESYMGLVKDPQNINAVQNVNVPIQQVRTRPENPQTVIQRYIYLGKGSTERHKLPLPDEYQEAIDRHDKSEEFNFMIKLLIKRPDPLRASTPTELIEKLNFYTCDEQNNITSISSKFNMEDKLYGMKESRTHLLSDLKKEQHPTIDTIHNALEVEKGKVNIPSSDREVIDYGTWLKGSKYKPEPSKEPMENVKRACKAAVSYTTKYRKPSPKRIHFELMSLDMAQIVTKTDKNKGNKPSITGSELRYLYREYLKKVRSGESACEVDFANVTFYFMGQPVNPPWEVEPELWEKYRPKLNKP